MKIGIGKIGKSVTFGDVTRNKKAMTSGAVDAPTVFRVLIKKYPEHQFYMIGKSDYYRLSEEDRRDLNSNENFTDAWEGFSDWKKKYTGPEGEEHIRYLDEWRTTSGVVLDVGIFFPGNMINIAVQGKSRTKIGTAMAKCLISASTYAGPLNHYLNESKLPYVFLLTDPRCYEKKINLDLMVPPKKILSQYDETIRVTHWTSYSDSTMVHEEIPAVYSGIESLYLIGHEEEPKKVGMSGFFEEEKTPEDRSSRLVLFLNEGNPSRYDEVAEYVLPIPGDVKVYGVWKHEKAAADPRFEEVPMSELSDQFSKIKYTFCVPIRKGWATGKFWDMIKIGIVPFVHPDYDSQRHIPMPEFLRVSSPEDFREKMRVLDSDSAMYDSLRRELSAMITPGRVSGSDIAETIMRAAEEVSRDNQAQAV